MIKLKPAQRIFFWNMLGSLSTALISVVLLMVVSRLLPAIVSDRYAFAYSLAHLLVVIGLFQVRNFQATDIEQAYSFTQYALVRILSCLMMVLVTVIYLVMSRHDMSKIQVIVYIVLYRLSDAISDLYQGLFQQHERLDLAGKSLAYRNSLIFLLFTLTLFVTKNLIFSLQILCLLSYLFIICYDMRQSVSFARISWRDFYCPINFHQAVQLMKECFPLFINGFLIIYIYNQPKYSLDTMTNIGKVALGTQTIFNILFMPAFVMNLMMLFFRPVITQMAVAITDHQPKMFKDLQKRLFMSLLMLSLLVVVGSGLLGLPVLEMLYGIDLKPYWLPFMLLMVGGAIGSFATAVDNILTAMRRQRLLVIPYVGAFLISLFVTDGLVATYQILGAALSFVVTMTVWLVLSVVLFQWIKGGENDHLETTI